MRYDSPAFTEHLLICLYHDWQYSIQDAERAVVGGNIDSDAYDAAVDVADQQYRQAVADLGYAGQISVPYRVSFSIAQQGA